MNKWRYLSAVFLLTILLAACGGSEAVTGGATLAVPAEAEVGAAVTLTEDYDDAASLRNQLALGTLRLEGTDQALTPGQA
ncbi:MAG: hypothetical protein JXM73_19165, partial [Anaerolineae bacterium]|nr:hypothetical protein [Anaerolineae bacterium]